jgi:hypothetical protein
MEQNHSLEANSHTGNQQMHALLIQDSKSLNSRLADSSMCIAHRKPQIVVAAEVKDLELLMSFHCYQ